MLKNNDLSRALILQTINIYYISSIAEVLLFRFNMADLLINDELFLLDLCESFDEHSINLNHRPLL